MIATAEVLTFQEGGGVLMVRVFASDTTRVEIAGDFTTPPWEPIRLDREGPFFVARLRLNSGKYRISVRVNEGEWRAPRNLARVRDDFGGEAGIVVIP
jgi:hypothetical protein